jgi:hypothetical protein
MKGKQRLYRLRVVGNRFMLEADLERLHKCLHEVERVDHVSDEMRALTESEWPERTHKLPQPRD